MEAVGVVAVTQKFVCGVTLKVEMYARVTARPIVATREEHATLELIIATKMVVVVARLAQLHHLHLHVVQAVQPLSVDKATAVVVLVQMMVLVPGGRGAPAVPPAVRELRPEPMPVEPLNPRAVIFINALR